MQDVEMQDICAECEVLEKLRTKKFCKKCQEEMGDQAERAADIYTEGMIRE